MTVVYDPFSYAEIDGPSQNMYEMVGYCNSQAKDEPPHYDAVMQLPSPAHNATGQASTPGYVYSRNPSYTSPNSMASETQLSPMDEEYTRTETTAVMGTRGYTYSQNPSYSATNFMASGDQLSPIEEHLEAKEAESDADGECVFMSRGGEERRRPAALGVRIYSDLISEDGEEDQTMENGVEGREEGDRNSMVICSAYISAYISSSAAQKLKPGSAFIW